MSNLTCKPKGFGLAVLLIWIPLLLVLVLALFVALDQGAQWTGTHQRRIATEFVAEAGAADALAHLRRQKDWVAGFENKMMSGAAGQYSIRFEQDPSLQSMGHPARLNRPLPGRDASINNFDGLHSDSYLGRNTVPLGTALVVVKAQIGSSVHRGVYLMGRGSTGLNVEHALLGSGKIHLEGETQLRGLESLSQGEKIPAKIQSNQDGNESQLILWRSNGAGTLFVDGEVHSSGSRSSAIDLSGYTPTGGSFVRAPQVDMPQVDILTTIDSKRHATPFNSSSRTVPNGDSFHSGDLEVHGDLKLEGDLYVSGSLRVNGSITGHGSVYVAETTDLHGDAEINGSEKVAVLSQGHVTLKGFDGDQYLDQLARDDASFQTWLNDSRWATQDLEVKMTLGSWTRQHPQAGTDYDKTLAVLTATEVGPSTYEIPGRTMGSLEKMKARVEQEQPGPTRNFITQKLDYFQRLFSPAGGASDEDKMLERYLASGNTDGLIEAANDTKPQLQPAAYRLIQQVNYDKFGSSYFQGLVYTNGVFRAENQVTVLGAVVAHDNGTQLPFSSSLSPGDISLTSGSNIKYIKDFFFGPNSVQPGPRRIILYLGDG